MKTRGRKQETKNALYDKSGFSLPRGEEFKNNCIRNEISIILKKKKKNSIDVKKKKLKL